MVPPVWFSETDDTSVSTALSMLSNTTGPNNQVNNRLNQSIISIEFYLLNSIFVFVYLVAVPSANAD